MSYDAIITHLGEFGPYQRFIYFLAWVTSFPNSFHMVNFVFLNEEPPFRCAVPGLDSDTFQIQNEAHSRLVNDSIPFDADTGQYSKCKAYVDYWNGSNILSNRSTMSCDRWVYDHDAAPNSMVPEFNLVCDRKIFKTHMGMVLMVGLLMGSLCGGTLSDFFGRKRICLVTLNLWIVLSVSMAFATSTIAVMMIKFCMSAFGIASFLVVYVLVAEMVGPSKRGVVALATMFPWSMALAVAPLVYFVGRDWRVVQLITTVPWVLSLSYWWLEDESPRWLLIKNKPEEAVRVIKRMAKWNKVELPPNIESIGTLGLTLDENNVRQDKVWTILGNKTMLLRLMILGLNWGLITMCYYGFTLNVGDILPGNLYVNVFLQSLLETGSIVLCIVCSRRMGRKPLYCGCITMAGIGCLLGSIFPLMSVDIVWVNLALFCVGRFGIGGAFASIYVVTAEMIPTTSRNFALGLCSVSGRAFGVIAPYIAAVGLLIPGKFGEVFPLMVFGIGSILCGLSIFLLPETRNKNLPDSVKNAVSVQRDWKPELQEMMAINTDAFGMIEA